MSLNIHLVYEAQKTLNPQSLSLLQERYRQIEDIFSTRYRNHDQGGSLYLIPILINKLLRKFHILKNQFMEYGMKKANIFLSIDSSLKYIASKLLHINVL